MQTTSKGAQGRRALELALGEQISALISANRALTEQSAVAFHDDLQPAAFHIARWLHAFGPARPSTVAEAVHMDRSSTSTLLGRMRSLGLVDTTRDPHDRRGVIFALTDEGRERVTATLEVRGEEFFRRLADWPDSELEQLTQLLRKIAGS
jgi:DNA-binding MarR family transcriptional regulator